MTKKNDLPTAASREFFDAVFYHHGHTIDDSFTEDCQCGREYCDDRRVVCFDGKIFVEGCPCNGLFRYESWILEHLHIISSYMTMRHKMLSDQAAVASFLQLAINTFNEQAKSLAELDQSVAKQLRARSELLDQLRELNIQITSNPSGRELNLE